MPIKSVKMKISKNQKPQFFLMPQGSLIPKIRFLCPKVCYIACGHTHTHRHTRKWIQRTPFQGFRKISIQPRYHQKSVQKQWSPIGWLSWRQGPGKRAQWNTCPQTWAHFQHTTCVPVAKRKIRLQEADFCKTLEQRWCHGSISC